ncbi:hypothetical protein pb186bvf_011100 [Paramecium bursaria]
MSYKIRVFVKKERETEHLIYIGHFDSHQRLMAEIQRLLKKENYLQSDKDEYDIYYKANLQWKLMNQDLSHNQFMELKKKQLQIVFRDLPQVNEQINSETQRQGQNIRKIGLKKSSSKIIILSCEVLYKDVKDDIQNNVQQNLELNTQEIIEHNRVMTDNDLNQYQHFEENEELERQLKQLNEVGRAKERQLNCYLEQLKDKQQQLNYYSKNPQTQKYQEICKQLEQLQLQIDNEYKLFYSILDAQVEINDKILGLYSRDKEKYCEEKEIQSKYPLQVRKLWNN